MCLQSGRYLSYWPPNTMNPKRWVNCALFWTMCSSFQFSCFFPRYCQSWQLNQISHKCQRKAWQPEVQAVGRRGCLQKLKMFPGEMKSWWEPQTLETFLALHSKNFTILLSDVGSFYKVYLCPQPMSYAVNRGEKDRSQKRTKMTIQ